MRAVVILLLAVGVTALVLSMGVETTPAPTPATEAPGASGRVAESVSPTGPMPPPVRAMPRAPDDACATCHREREPGLLAQWDASRHAKVGVRCTDCHGDDHDAMFAVEGRVPASACARCHAKETRTFLASVHAQASKDARGNGRFLAQIPAVQRRGCLACHDSGGETGRCNGCHGAHRHSAADARRPEACGVCHMGPDHPHLEAWEASPHGVVYGATHDTRQAPTCVTCHMDGGTHDVSRGVTIGRAGSGAVLEGEVAAIPMRHISKARYESERAKMLAICKRCHTIRVARTALEDADAIKREADRLVGEAARIVRTLHADGLLDPDPAERPPHPTAGHALVLGGPALYENHSPAERVFFDMAKFAHSITFKAAYHQSADWTHWLGVARLKEDFEQIKAIDRRLRAK